MFPNSIRGEFEISTVNVDQLVKIIKCVEIELTKVQAFEIKCDDTKITFRGGLFRFVSNWNVLIPVHKGMIEIIPGAPARIIYIFSCIEILIIATLISLVLGAAIILSHPNEKGIYFCPLFIWLWLFGMNYLIALVRLPEFVRRTLELSIHNVLNQK